MVSYWNGLHQEFIGQDAESLPAVMIRDQLGRPMAGVKVTFEVTSGGGTLRQPQSTTDIAGIARLEHWKLGPAPGENSVTAKAERSLSVVFKVVTKAADDPCTGCWDY